MHARPLVVGHRGSPTLAPENTIPSFRLAWEEGADAIEGDFHLTSDKRIVCIHDDTTRRFRGPKRVVRKTKLPDLQTLDAGSWRGEQWTGTTIPTCADVLATVPAGKRVYLEIKSSPRILRHLYRVLDDSALAPSQIVVIAFSSRVIQRLKRDRPDIEAYLLVDLKKSRLTGDLSPNPSQLLATLKRIHADGLSLGAHHDVDAAFVAPILAAGYSLHVWTVDTPEEARRWTDLGASSITTNVPQLLKQSQ